MGKTIGIATGIAVGIAIETIGTIGATGTKSTSKRGIRKIILKTSSKNPLWQAMFGQICYYIYIYI